MPLGLTRLATYLGLRLAEPNAVLLLSLLAIPLGIASALLVLLLRVLIELGQTTLLGQPEAFESLPPLYRLLLPLLGGLLLGVLFQLLRAEWRSVGIVHVLERLEYHHGHLPLANAAIQLIATVVTLTSGHSVGREGPSVHLGAASGSLFGQLLRLPNNALRILIACGVAAAIGASFNTPLAGVIFAMEVVLMEYTLAGFTPVIVATVTATAVSRTLMGGAPLFDLTAIAPLIPTDFRPNSDELLLLFLLGLLAGVIATLFVRGLLLLAQLSSGWPPWRRMTLAGGLVGVVGLLLPEALGGGYDSINQALIGAYGVTLLLLLIPAKLIASASALGLGLPGGVIGPSLVLGAAVGGAFGFVASALGSEGSPALFVIIGMGAMMSAILQAPLAALTAVLELTYQPQAILPAMAAIVTANLTARLLLHRDSLFRYQLRLRRQDLRDDPIRQARRRIGITAVMERELVRVPAEISRSSATALLGYRWLLLDSPQGSGSDPLLALMSCDALAHYLNESSEGRIALHTIPARRLYAAFIPWNVTLDEAAEVIESGAAEALIVQGPDADDPRSALIGVVTGEMLKRVGAAG